MSIAHPPSVFLSSTCYDLSQVRKDLESFIESMGLLPILSESSSFPVNPNIDAIENCLTIVKEKADIFILVVGGRYGSKTENGKSVTNLEYLEAKVKDIPCYVFVQKPVLTALPIWRKNRSCDFSEIVDSTRLFEFVNSLYDSKEKNWVFHFESAQDIIGILRKQLAYLFMDALAIRGKVLRSGLSDEANGLSGAALRLAVQKPFAWEYRLFSQVLCDEISNAASIKRDFNYGIALGKTERLGDIAQVIEWSKMKLGEMQSLVSSANVIFTAALPKAFGAPGEPGDVEEIIYAAKRLAEFYRRILEWNAEFRHIQVEDEFHRLLELTSKMSHNAIGEIETFAVECNKQIEGAVRRYEESNQTQSLNRHSGLTHPFLKHFLATTYFL